MKSFDKALDRLISLEMDPEKKADAEDRSKARAAVITHLGVKAQKLVDSAIIESSTKWDPVLKRTKKRHGRKSEEYQQVLAAKKESTLSFIALGKGASGRR